MMWGTLVPLLPTVLRHWWGFSRLGGVVLSGHMCMMLDMTSTHEPLPINPSDDQLWQIGVRGPGAARALFDAGVQAGLATLTPRPLDQAPAADPALDALNLLEGTIRHHALTFRLAEIATIREALADRITPAEAQELLAWSRYLKEKGQGEWPYWPFETALIARLGKIAEQGHDAALTARIIARNDQEAGR